MKLVINANIAFSLLKKDSFTRRLVHRYRLSLISHPFIVEELKGHSEIVCRKIGVSPDKFLRIMEILSALIDLSRSASPQQLNRARSLLPDPEDAPYLALAIRLKLPLWSNDPHLKEQSLVTVFTTEELVELLGA